MKFSNQMEGRTSPLLAVYFERLQQLHPMGMKAKDMPIRDVVGALILIKSLNHFIDNEELRFLSIIYTSMMGSGSQLRPPRDGESFVSLIDQVNN